MVKAKTDRSREMTWQKTASPIREEVQGFLKNSPMYLTRLFTEKRRVVSPKKQMKLSKKSCT